MCRLGLRDKLIGRSLVRGTAAGIAAALFVAFVTMACQKQAPSKSALPENAANGRLVLELLQSIRSGTANPEIDGLVSGKSSVSQSDPDWPTITYLLGETHWQRGQVEPAREKFRALVSWAASKHPGPYGDTWGGSGLAAVGLWRWLQILDQREPREAEEVGQVIRMASALEETRLFGGMVTGGFLPASPLLEEDIKHLLAHVAWKARRPEAGSLFLDFLMVNSSATLDKIDTEIKQDLLKKGAVVEGRLELFRARRLLGLIETNGQNRGRAEEILKHLWEDESAPPDVRAEAGYEWANSRRLQRDKAEPLRMLTGVLALVQEGPIAEQALFRRATIYNRGPAARNFDAFRADMLELLERFPTSGLADDALFQLATEHLFRVDIDAASAFFERLRAFSGPNDFEDSAYFLPALGLIGRGNEADLGSADQLLETYLQRHPDGAFRLRCLFWRARIAEAKPDAKLARRLFEQIVNEAPYDYYAIRARMHLEAGAAAITQPVPEPDSKTRHALNDAYRASRADTVLSGQSVYHARLRSAVASGLYRELFGAGEKTRERIDEVPLQRLDELGLVPAVSLLLALRQDALAAKDSEPTADNCLRIAGLLGLEARDWPLALEIATVHGQAQRARVLELQRDFRYLATLYPDLVGLRLAEPLARAAWPIEGSRTLSESLMYSIMRQESRFYPKAVSQAGALGLFQIMPDLFKRLNGKWQLLDGKAARSGAEYLLDADNNIRLWSRWVESEFPLRNRSDVAQTMMMHQAGAPSVRAWRSYWQKLGGAGDIEYRVETARYNPTRNFVRGALRDMAIIDAAGVFDGGSSR